MTDQDSSRLPKTGTRTFLIAWIFTIAGAINCILVTVLFTISEVTLQDGVVSAIWPLPLIYFIEIICIGILGAIAMINIQKQSKPVWVGIPWICAGFLLAFVILGAWTIGFFLIPAMILFLIVGVISDKHWQGDSSLHLIYFIAAGIAQSILVLFLLYI